MSDLLWPLVSLLNDILPGWVRLPDLTFRMPHWLYWGTLLVFPLVAMVLYFREQAKGGGERVGMATGYMLLITGGFVGLHRFYARSFRWGLTYVVLFVALLYANGQAELARNSYSNVNNSYKDAKFQVEHWGRLVARGRDRFKPRLEQARVNLAAVEPLIKDARARHEAWPAFAGFFAWIIALLLIVDLFLMPAAILRARAAEAGLPPPEEFDVMERGEAYDPRREVSNPLSRLIGRVNGGVGNFIALWSVIAVFVYYFEVVSRYVFNSPTNWAHEGMFIMFGMQYVLAGGYAYREEAHVRVDVIYEKFSPRGRAILDIVSSSAFFVFTIVLVITAWTFAVQAMPADGPWERSFTEWQLQYWPAKLVIFLGSILILVQGVAKLSRDIQYIAAGRNTRSGAPRDPGDAGTGG